MRGRGDVFAPVGIDPLPSSPTQPPTSSPTTKHAFPLPSSHPVNNMRFPFVLYCIDGHISFFFLILLGEIKWPQVIQYIEDNYMPAHRVC